MAVVFRFLFSFIFLFTALYSTDLPPSVEVMTPMRDGTFLSGDLYLPSKDALNLPTILIRSPAGKKTPYALQHLSLLQHGYAIYIQETRSSKDGEGKTLPFLSDGWGEMQDGYDTVVWLGKQPFSNGKVGTVGPSALGITQLLMAPTAPPGLISQHITFASPNLYRHAIFHDGELLKDQAEGWLKLYARHPDVYQKVVTQPKYNDFWTQLNALPLAKNVHVPAIHIGGWYDTFLKGTVDAFTTLQNEGGKGAKGNQKMIIGPWTHLWPLVKMFGDFEYPKEALTPPIDFSPEKWFGYTLKGESNGIEKLPTVTYYVMGPFDGSSKAGNHWKTSNEWPIPVKKKELFLQGDKNLLFSSPKENDKIAYTYDPENPTPTIGGRNLFMFSGPADQRPIENRSDVLVFTTPPFEKDVELTGNIDATLFVESDQEDTDFSVRLTDVYPDGKSILIADGISRLSHTVESLNTPHPPHKISVDLWPTSIVIAKGHCLRVIVASANYPRYEKNLNTKKRAHESTVSKVAKNTIYVGKETPSHITLPVVD